MVLLTMIARVADGLPLAASMQEDEQVGRGVLAWTGPARPGPARSGPVQLGLVEPVSLLSFRLRPGPAVPRDQPFLEPLGRGWGVFAG